MKRGRELTDLALELQLHAFAARAARMPLGADIEAWMDSKDFAPADRAALRALWREATTTTKRRDTA